MFTVVVVTFRWTLPTYGPRPFFSNLYTIIVILSIAVVPRSLKRGVSEFGPQPGHLHTLFCQKDNVIVTLEAHSIYFVYRASLYGELHHTSIAFYRSSIRGYYNLELKSDRISDDILFSLVAPNTNSRRYYFLKKSSSSFFTLSTSFGLAVKACVNTSIGMWITDPIAVPPS